MTTPDRPTPSIAGVGEAQVALADGEIRVRVPYDPDLVTRMRSIPGRRWDPGLRVWRIPDTSSARNALRRALGVEVEVVAGSAARPSAAGCPRSEDLLRRFEEEMRLRGHSPRTRKCYLGHARRFLGDLSEDEGLSAGLRRHILGKLEGRGMSRAYHIQLVSALRLFCSSVLGSSVDDLPLERPRREQRLPTVLSRDELRRFLGAVRYPKHRAILATAYSAGLRVGEVVRLRPEDLDRERGLIRVRMGKGRKDRYTLLSDGALCLIDAYLEGAEPGKWLFPGGRPGRHLNARSVQVAAARAGRRAGISKHVTPHVLRHSFATHLMEAGTDIRFIQELLGHASVRTTEIYTHVSRRHIERIRSPFDEPMEEKRQRGR
jgi:integrase/recombinase XerD